MTYLEYIKNAKKRGASTQLSSFNQTKALPSSQCCGSELGLIGCESLTSLPSQVETPKHTFEVLKLLQLHLRGKQHQPTYWWCCRPSDWPKQPRSCQDPYFQVVFFGT
jgi:hypothetical protein